MPQKRAGRKIRRKGGEPGERHSKATPCSAQLLLQPPLLEALHHHHLRDLPDGRPTEACMHVLRALKARGEMPAEHNQHQCVGVWALMAGGVGQQGHSKEHSQHQGAMTHFDSWGFPVSTAVRQSAQMRDV